MKVMRWRKKINKGKQVSYILSKPIVLVVLAILITLVSISPSRTALADIYQDHINGEFLKFGSVSVAKDCAKHIRNVGDMYVKLRDLTSDNSKYHSDKAGEHDRNGWVKCDLNELASNSGNGNDYLCNYLKKHVRGSDGKVDTTKINSDGGRNNDSDNINAHLDKCDLDSLVVTNGVIANAFDSLPDYTPSKETEAAIYRNAVEKFCVDNGKEVLKEAEKGDKEWAYPDDNGKWVVKRGYINYKEDKSDRKISVVDGGKEMTCAEAAQKASNLANDFAKAMNDYLDKHPEEKQNQKKDDEERIEQNKENDECAAELNGFGSIICSGQNLFATITDILYGTIAKMLVDQTELTKSDTVRKHWGNFLTIANIILIIAFLVVIYSTATSTGGLSNYDVKKLLPRIIIFAIAINLSFYICMALVDLSTIVGKGIFGLLMGGSTGAPPQLINSAQKTAGVLESAGIVVAMVAIAAVLVILVGAPIILALLAIVFALVVRGIALMILVIVSPVAIALYLFNNQGLSKGFTMWRDNYIKLLLVYPLFMLVWGGTRVVSGLVNQGDQGGINALFVLLVETICLITPALSIMPLFKASGDIMGKATLMAATNGATNKFAGWAGSKLTGKPGDPKHPGLKGMAAGAIGAAAGAAAGRAAGAVQNMRGTGASTGNIATQLDSQAMNSARNKVNKYGDRDLKTAFITGQIGGKTLDPYQMRAVIEKELPNASAAEVKQSMQAVNTEADRLRRNGQAADADRLVQTFANTASANGNSIMSGKSLRNFATSGGWNTSQFEANYADAVADYSSTQLTAKDAAGMDAADLIQMRTTLQNAGVNGGNIAQADAGLSSMAKQSNIALSDPKLTRKMNAPTVTALKDNTMVRSTAGERLANTHKIPNIYHDYNAGGTTSAQAISDARTMMAHTDFGRLDAIDQSRLRAIARASAPTGTGAPAAPVVIASWDSRVP